MHFRDYWTITQTRLEQALAQQIPLLFSALDPHQIATVQGIIKDGKRIRGGLVCLVNHALGGSTENALSRAVAIECIQAASLIHDDYVDNDVLRRKRPATWTVEGPRRAVLLGDVIFATAIQSMVELSSEDGATVTRAIATVANGAYQELSWLAEPTSLGNTQQLKGDVYERLIYLKTGALFGAACRLGAIATGASQETRALAYAFGTKTGEAYQIADDLRDFIRLREQPQENIKKLPLLWPALNYFCHTTGLKLPLSLAYQHKALYRWCQRIGQDFIAHMEQEMQHRLALAKSSIEHFPNNTYTRILSETPAEIAAMMHPPPTCSGFTPKLTRI
jgi:geranylgeranyl pyrophosphate synthase